MVGVGVYFYRSRCKVTDSIEEVADLTFVGHKPSLHYWLIPADYAALTPEPRLMENDLRHSLKRGRGMRGQRQPSWFAGEESFHRNRRSR